MPAPLYQQTHLGLALAMRALHATLEAAEQHGVRVSIAVVDASGLPIHTAHMDGAPQPSRDIALHKAAHRHAGDHVLYGGGDGAPLRPGG